MKMSGIKQEEIKPFSALGASKCQHLTAFRSGS